MNRGTSRIPTIKGIEMPSFADLPDAERMAYRFAIDAAGGLVENYVDDCVAVAVPNPPGPFWAAMTAAGLRPVGGRWLFPVGSDAPPDTLRHDGRYPGSKGFWMFQRMRPLDADATPVPELEIV